MKITKSQISSDLIMVCLSGSFDAIGADDIDMEMRKVSRAGKNVAVDLSEVTFITSQGVRILVMAAKVVNATNKKLVLLGPKPPIHKVLSIMGVDKLLDIYETVDAMTAMTAL